MCNMGDIRMKVRETACDYDIEKVYLFGSYARGEANDASDVDLCLETGQSFSLLNAGELSYRLKEALGTAIDMVTERSLYGFVRESCLRDRILIYERV